MSEVFVRASPADQDAASAVARAIERRGLAVSRTVQGDGRKPGNMDRARALVVLWSQAAAIARTPQDTAEAIRAWSEDRLILVRLDDAELPSGLRDLAVIRLDGGRQGWKAETIAAIAAAADRAGAPRAGILTAAAGAMGTLAQRFMAGRRKAAGSSSYEDLNAGPLDVFVCHGHPDHGAVQRIVQEIERARYSVGMDRGSGDGGQQQRSAGTTAGTIGSSRTVALMWSATASACDAVFRQVYVAGVCHKPFLVCHLDGSELPDEVWFFVAGYRRLAVDPETPEQAVAEIVKFIERGRRDPATRRRAGGSGL